MRYTAETPAIGAAASTTSGTFPPGAEHAATISGTPATRAGRAFIRRVDGYAAFPPGTYTPARATGRTRCPRGAPEGEIPNPPPTRPEVSPDSRGHLPRPGGTADLRPSKRLPESRRSRPVPPHASRLLFLHPGDVGAQGGEPVFQRLVPAVEVVDPEHLGRPRRGQPRQHQRSRGAKVGRHHRAPGKP